jgi:phosphohistidine swiveling domain-containing protein
MGSKFTVFKIERQVSLPAAAGGKALGLQAILRAGLNAPRSWVVLPQAGAEEILRLAYMLAGEGRSLAVRSSAEEEDGTASSFAGIHESRLGVSPSELPDAIRTVAASTLSERALAYRKERGLNPAQGHCAVVVQPMIAADIAGVAFDADQAGGRVVIEAVEGLGELLVQGTETPELWELMKRGSKWEVLRQKARRQRSALRIHRGTLSRISIPENDRSARALTQDLASGIAGGLARLRAIMRSPLDVEWCVEGNEIFFVQSRPRTRPLGMLPPGILWSRSNFRDVLPDVPSALARSYVRHGLSKGIRDFLSPFGVLQGKDVPLVTCIYGRPVANASASIALMDMLGVPHGLMDSTMGGVSKSVTEFVPMNWWRLARHPAMALRSLRNSLTAEQRARRHIIWMRRVREQRRTPIEAMSDSDIQVLLGPQMRDGAGEFALVSVLLVSALQGIHYRAMSMLRKLPDPTATLTRLVAARLNTVTGQLTEDLVELALQFREWKESAAFLDPITVEHASPRRWERLLPTSLFDAVGRWMDRYGHRGIYESDLSYPRYRDDWRLLAHALRPLVLSLSARRARVESDGNRMWAGVRVRCGTVRQRLLETTLKKMRELLALREELRDETVNSIYPMRSAFLEAGRRLASRGRLVDAEDIWHLQVEEIERAFADPEFDASQLVAREKRRVAVWKRIDVPNKFHSGDEAGFGYRASGVGETSPVLRGTGVSPGIAEGRARLMETPAEADILQPGDILVAPTTDPGWTPLFARAGAVVVEMGGLLSHAGIVAREYGIPCVSNVEGAPHKLTNNSLLRVNGTIGQVEILEVITTEPDKDNASCAIATESEGRSK